MKKWILLLLVIMLALSGCGKDQTDVQSTYTAPTLPSVDTTLSPEAQLTAAIHVLKTADSFQMTFGTGEDTHTQAVTPPSDPEALTQVKALVPNENFILDLCAGRITLSPSNTGSLTFALNGISATEFTAITGIATEAKSCSIALTVAPEGHLSCVELQMDDTVTFLRVTNVK